MSHIFVSYIRENSEEVERLCDEMKKHGVKVWLDRNEIKPGYRWKDAIREAIRGGDFFIACFSKEYMDREKTYMNEELALAIQELRQYSTIRAWFIPLLLSECDVPDRSIGAGESLRDIQWVELYKDWDAGIQRILEVIQPIRVKAIRLAHLMALRKRDPDIEGEFLRYLNELNMVYVSKGDFIHGSERYGEPGKFRFEDTHSTTMEGFCIDKYPVTNQDFMHFVRTTGYPAPSHWPGGNCPEHLMSHPVTNIHYTDAESFAEWVGKRLPTQWEWEKAARGTDGREFPWGDEFDPQKCNTRESACNQTTPVDNYPNGRSPYGCWDMAGNVWEWTLTPEGQDKIPLLQGGSYMDYQYQARSSYRALKREQITYETIGFRCVIGLN